MQNLVIHIAFYYKDDRLEYINNIISESWKYPFANVSIFIHTNKNFDLNYAHVIVHNLEYIHTFALTWICGNLMYDQRDLYNAFMYIEDEILVPAEALQYWQEVIYVMRSSACY